MTVSDMQIWVFGVLAFIVLLLLVTRLTRRRRAPWPVAHQEERQFRKLAQDSIGVQEGLQQDLTKVREETAEIRSRLESIEQLLKSVD
ncbi:MAG: hypothetical protein ACRDP8_03435 [Actinopolymorphaceae bacterium]